jgi:hypothetical protein
MADEKPEELTETTVLINGLEHTLLLNEEDAERYEKAESSTRTKAKTPANKSKG